MDQPSDIPEEVANQSLNNNDQFQGSDVDNKPLPNDTVDQANTNPQPLEIPPKTPLELQREIAQVLVDRYKNYGDISGRRDLIRALAALQQNLDLLRVDGDFSDFTPQQQADFKLWDQVRSIQQALMEKLKPGLTKSVDEVNNGAANTAREIGDFYKKMNDGVYKDKPLSLEQIANHFDAIDIPDSEETLIRQRDGIRSLNRELGSLSDNEVADRLSQLPDTLRRYVQPQVDRERPAAKQHWELSQKNALRIQQEQARRDLRDTITDLDTIEDVALALKNYQELYPNDEDVFVRQITTAVLGQMDRYDYLADLRDGDPNVKKRPIPGDSDPYTPIQNATLREHLKKLTNNWEEKQEAQRSNNARDAAEYLIRHYLNNHTVTVDNQPVSEIDRILSSVYGQDTQLKALLGSHYEEYAKTQKQDVVANLVNTITNQLSGLSYRNQRYGMHQAITHIQEQGDQYQDRYDDGIWNIINGEIQDQLNMQIGRDQALLRINSQGRDIVTADLRVGDEVTHLAYAWLNQRNGNQLRVAFAASTSIDNLRNNYQQKTIDYLVTFGFSPEELQSFKVESLVVSPHEIALSQMEERYFNNQPFVIEPFTNHYGNKSIHLILPNQEVFAYDVGWTGEKTTQALHDYQYKYYDDELSDPDKFEQKSAEIRQYAESVRQLFKEKPNEVALVLGLSPAEYQQLRPADLVTLMSAFIQGRFEGEGSLSFTLGQVDRLPDYQQANGHGLRDQGNRMKFKKALVRAMVAPTIQNSSAQNVYQLQGWLSNQLNNERTLVFQCISEESKDDYFQAVKKL